MNKSANELKRNGKKEKKKKKRKVKEKKYHFSFVLFDLSPINQR